MFCDFGAIAAVCATRAFFVEEEAVTVRLADVRQTYGKPTFGPSAFGHRLLEMTTVTLKTKLQLFRNTASRRFQAFSFGI